MGKKVIVLRRPGRPVLAAMLLIPALLLSLGRLAGEEIMEPVLAPALFGVSIVIDPGHGGWDPGMVGDAAKEKDVNLAAGMKLAEYCRAAGASVTLTRQEDAALAESKREDLQARADLGREADIFISLHCNSFVAGPAQHGAQVFYAAGNEEGQRLAEALQLSLRDRIGTTDRNALPHPDSYLLRNLEGPAVIVEMGFLSNAAEEERLAASAYQWDLAWALFSGIADYLAAE